MKNILSNYLYLFFISFAVTVLTNPSVVYSSPIQQAAIATAHPIATRAGQQILEQGGNAFDAAVAISATLAVVEPFSSGIGGGGFWLLQDVKSKKTIMIDGREKAPLAANETMYQDKQGNVIRGLSINGALAAGIPGEPAALVHIAERYGRLPLSQSLSPAIQAAKKGFRVTPMYRRMVRFRLKALRRSPAAAKVFLYRNKIPRRGYLIKQADLAKTLQAIAAQGHAGFYQGEVAKALVNGTRAARGIWSLKDLATYQVKERQPIIGQYKNYKIISAAPPSSGGIALVTMLNILEQYDLDKMQPAQRMHLVVEAMRRAYRDRAEFLGDSDFISIPFKQLTSKPYAKELANTISLKQATPSSALKTAVPVPQGQHTTHFSVVDNEGNKVSATLSINYPFGSAFMPPGTGVLLNDEMDDFSSKPGAPNVYGLVGNKNNAIEAGKRMLSSMSPTIIENINNSDYAVIGTPGGSRIITMVLHGILGFTAGHSAKAIVSAPRYHHQYLPDLLQIEKKTITRRVRKNLILMQHTLKELNGQYGNMQLVISKNNKINAASDPRGEGLALIIK
ncbi:Gamma-glutamyltranspeptidase @ Glutathione hydrolase [hydrothermal vent metagenome]|uniref:Gamma-glutamyltranspeptidase @ Glutathione hydrolase n=1 Tax=hydrothermal vent metagenome TaxID=652676 RepID=A0A3B1A8Y0_9ZZZZ